jgi:alkanesulfonate monooxygenase SsuD/methylene tetrahydromethanopterin reductase-like flavin-dependent oxidoreductase (luciferase family)
MGLPYAYAYFFSDGRGVEEALAMYRQNYQASQAHPRPQATICVWALAADTEQEARHLLKSREHWRVGFEQGLRLPLVSPEQAERQSYGPADQARIEALRARAMVGTAEQVLEKIQALATQLQLDEIVINTWAWDPLARRRSYELIAKAAGQV